MIKTEKLIGRSGKEYIRTSSDAGMMVMRNDGVLFVSAVDPADSGRTYTETDRPIERGMKEK